MKVGKIDQSIVFKSISNSQPLKPIASQQITEEDKLIKQDSNLKNSCEEKKEMSWGEKREIEKEEQLQELINKPGKFAERKG